MQYLNIIKSTVVCLFKYWSVYWVFKDGCSRVFSTEYIRAGKKL